MTGKQFFLSLVLTAAIIVAQAASKTAKQVFIPMDYSTCGYHASETMLPSVEAKCFVACVEGDNSPRIQQAINYVSSLKPDSRGFRGAVLLGEGTFTLHQPLRIHTSGVVVRGMGKGKTRLLKTGVDRGAMLYIEGENKPKMGDSIAIVDDKVAAGSVCLTLKDASSITVGDRVQVVRPSTKEWIQSLGMASFGGNLDYTGWKPTDIDITWTRVVTNIAGNTVTLDAPITTTLSAIYGGGVLVEGFNEGEITECAVENLTMESAKNEWNPKDEDHCWEGVRIDNARDCWVRRVDFRHLAGSAVNIQKWGSRITVEDCIADEPISEVGGWRRNVFLVRGQQVLVQRCVSRCGIHDFAADFCAAGPNAFVQCEAEEALGFSGSIGSWAAGLLFDIVNIDGNDLRFGNLEQFQFGTGWNTANAMFWQCTASTVWCYSPDNDNRCSAHGCWGTLTGNGEWTESNNHVKPRSLFYSQLEKRLGDKAPNGYILPRDMEASTSPTVQQAMQWAKQSVEGPRLTLEQWMDSIPFAPSLSSAGVMTVEKVKTKDKNTDEMGHFDYAVTNGRLVKDGALLTGNQYNITWWAGRVKDNFTTHGAKPVITRFVPGRSGTGWTDNISEVVDYLAAHHYGMLYHHYGLWYDLRRTDHERIRRADGDVWAPFYEQPFARSGQGTANDGLSRYDLTRPNAWYWSRMNSFAAQAASKGILLFNNHYFQHNILEAGAHWVDSPWRPVNNVNSTPFPEPVPFTGDKRIFMAEQFYDISNPTLRDLHRQYIRMCLEETKDQPNVVHLISAEYTGPEHFMRFWLQTIAEWEQQTGCHPLVAISATKDVQDALLADDELNKTIDIIDIRYWHYNEKGLWAPEGGKNLAPRQWMRKMPKGATSKENAYKAVREYTEKYPDKAVTFYAQDYPNYGWAILMAGGSMPNVQIDNRQLLQDVVTMRPTDAKDCYVLANDTKGYLIAPSADNATATVAEGRYNIYTIDRQTGHVALAEKRQHLSGVFVISPQYKDSVVWLQRK